MTRFEFENGPLTITYGQDEITGVFFSVADSRLIPDEEAQSKEVYEICNSYNAEEGIYLELTNSKHGFGKKVSDETLIYFMKKFGVKQEHIDQIFPYEAFYRKLKDSKLKPGAEAQKNETINDNCTFCGKPNAKSICAKCHFVNYCSKDCQTKDWKIHKLICDPIPAKTKSTNSVYGINLPEKSAKACLVEVPLKRVHDEEGSFLTFEKEKYFGKELLGHYSLPMNHLKGGQPLTNALEINYKDNFLRDGSVENACVAQLTQNAHKHSWRGPILVLKKRGISNINAGYIDMSMKDIQDIADFFSWYGMEGYKIIN
jgi:hypothetical protein